MIGAPVAYRQTLPEARRTDHARCWAALAAPARGAPVPLKLAGRLLGNRAARAGAALQKLCPRPARPGHRGQRGTEGPLVAGGRFGEEGIGPTGPHPWLQV